MSVIPPPPPTDEADAGQNNEGDTTTTTTTTTPGQRFKELRTSRELSQGKLAQAAGLSPSTIVKLEHDERVPSASVKKALALALKIDNEELDRLIGWPDPYQINSYNHRQPLHSPAGSSGDRLKALRLTRHLTQSQLARRLDLTDQAYGRLERGYTKQIEPALLEALAQILGNEVRDIYQQ